ncbi:gamma-glutamyl-gamma-aminobutyrate hydrolase family protein [Cetobacterium somerae]|uniref:gamma-glutamyl-gamma-aminobutyrate hydrolase family protein n=1 Tax=Cetobacterium sp. NK01 TaxID=2993530 RepID=UPI0021162B6F|nr:gamma-glutamyl-gamma-aminobutyrate hydrolase family protein [Cetobacterium sp. NK01]MCQ8211147.1 gamma-glutamyl-gamma-aminobutyrate hydrolase family protein [Cetobacterium sp. NK01]
MRKPIIGITSSHEKENGLRNYHRTTVSIDYTKGVIEGGGIPIIIPTTGNIEVIKEQLKLLDGLILSGGPDINPIYYGEDFKEKMGVISPERDDNEIKILEEFLKTEKPILGICRGHQLLNIYFGGTLYQDLSYFKDEVLKHRQDLYPELEVHNVFIEKNSTLEKLYGESIRTNSFHHQAVKNLGKGFKIIAKSSDGVVEAIEKIDHKFCLGIQWHPEMMVARGNKDMVKIFKLLVEKSY